MKGRLIYFALLLLLAVFAASTVYFFLKSQDKNNNSSSSSSQTTAATTITPTAAPAGTTTPASSPYTKPAASSKQPSNPAETYTFQAGDTLSSIGDKLDISWTSLATINNISNPDNVTADQVLIIPSIDDKTNKGFIAFKTDQSKAAEIQHQATADPTNIYLDPVTAAKATVPPIYGITATDTFTKVSSNEFDGTAVVNISHGDKSYQVNLIQPITKGKGGIWAVSKIQPS